MVQVEITHLNLHGQGIGRHRGKEYRVDYAYPGDVVEIYTPRRGRWGVRRVVHAGEHRVEPECPHFMKCGSCRWLGMRYTSQLRFKREMMQRLFQREVEVLPSPAERYYRNRMDYTIGRDAIGMRRYGSYAEVESALGCLLFSPHSDTILTASAEFFRHKKLEHYDILRRRGFLRYLVVREGKRSGRRMIAVVTHEGTFPLDEYAEALSGLAQEFVWAVNPTLTDTSRGEVRAGRGCFEEKLCGLSFRVPPFSFFQTNTLQAERMVELVRKLVCGSRQVVDVYCGAGTFGIAVAECCGEVLGIEEDAEAVRAAESNAELNGVTNLRLISGRAEEVMPGIERAEAVILDPPRAGLHPKVVKALRRLMPENIVYISCNPRTQARDIAALGYELQEVVALDMFPHTPHIESIAHLTP